MRNDTLAALTPGEWAEFLDGASGDAVDETERSMRVSRLRRDMADAALTARRYAAAAAIALHGQPSGFTWKDVDDLLAEAGSLDQGTGPSGGAQTSGEDGARHRERAARIRGLAGRIAALLPPREDAFSQE